MKKILVLLLLAAIAFFIMYKMDIFSNKTERQIKNGVENVLDKAQEAAGEVKDKARDALDDAKDAAEKAVKK